MESYPEITSAQQLQAILEGNKLTIIAFYTSAHEILNSMGMIADRIATRVRLARCDINKLPGVQSQYQITADPTFIAFKDGQVLRKMEGVTSLLSSLPELSKSLAASDTTAAGPSADTMWLGSPLSAKNYANITGSVELPGVDILNANTSLGGARVLFDAKKPSGDPADGVESDTDEQLMLFIPFQAAVKLHSIQITSLAPGVDAEDEDAPSRPATVKLFCNTHHIVGFEEAEEREATQTVTLEPKDWNKDGTAVINTKFVKFQNCSALTIFFVDVEREGAEKVRVDRIRLIGEVMGEKVDMSKLKQEQE